MKLIQPRALAVATALFVAQSASAVTTTVVVEFEGDPAAVEMARARSAGQEWNENQIENYRADLAFAQDAILSDISAYGVDYTIGSVGVADYTGLPAEHIEFRYTMVLNGVAMEVPIEQVATLNQVPGVKKVHHAGVMTLNLDQSVDFVHANDVYGGDHALNAFDTLLEGFEGQGINLSVIDSGMEHQHEMFGGDPTAPRLGVAPYSAAVPTNEKVIYSLPMSDPGIEDGFGHGTHVASTAGGYLGYTFGPDGLPLTDDDVPLHGVAPQARLMNYPVCSAVGSASSTAGCLTQTIIMALEDSVSPRTVNGFPKPVAHVINLSLGGANGTPNDATASASSNAALAGAIVVAAAGNDGDNRSIVGSPSTGTHVISVAASTDPGSSPESGRVGSAAFGLRDQQADVLVEYSVDLADVGLIEPASGLASSPTERQDIRIFQMGGTPETPSGAIAQNYVYVETGNTPLEYPASVAGRIAFVAEGGTAGAFTEAVQYAASNDAAGVVLRTTSTNATAGAGTIPAWTMLPEDFDYLISLMGNNPADGQISNHPIRIELSPAEQAAITDFSSRGPVAGFGQVKPDLSAPGANVLAGLPPASFLGGVAAETDGPSYGSVSGTSMASPHVAGAAALVKQANPTWGPAEVRTALINTSTPMRDFNGVEDSYGSHNAPIHAQGGGLIHVADAVNAQALMGVRGDGVATPSILGSHSFAAEPVLNNLCVSAQSVTVDIVETRGTGGTYNLRVADNRRAETTLGADPFVSVDSVFVAPGGSASFDVGMIIDSAAFTSDVEEFQFFVIAERDDGTESLSMPIFFRATPSIPATSAGDLSVATQTYSGTIGAGASDASAAIGTTTVEVPVEVGNGVFRLIGNLDGAMITSAGYPDYDMRLLDPTGAEIGSSGNIGSIENIDATINAAGTYTFVIENYAGGPGSYNLEVQQHSAGNSIDASPAVVSEVDVEFDVDIDGNYTLSWTGTGDETSFIVEERVDGGSWNELAMMNPATTSLQLSRNNGQYEYRVISHFPGAVCTYIADPSNVVLVEVERRELVNVTADYSIVGGDFGASDFDLLFINNSGVELVKPVTVTVVPQAGYTVENGDVGPGTFAIDAVIDGNEWSDDESTTSAITVDFDGKANSLFTISVSASGYRVIN